MPEVIYDVSMMIYPGMLVWHGDPDVSIDQFKSIARGDSSNVSLMRFGTHTGTHIDAPLHFVPGAIGVDAVKPEVLTGKCRLVRFADTQRIDRKTLQGIDLRGVTRLLLATKNSALLKLDHIDLGYAFLSGDGAEYLVELGIKLVGIDYLSIEEYHKEGRPTHHILLEAGIVIIEGLDLMDVPAGDYELICAPLKIRNADGAPARVFLRKQ